MRHFVDLRMGQTVRLTTPYLDAARGIYTVIYVYRNGWLGIVSREDGRRFDVPGHLCRQLDASYTNVERSIGRWS